MLDWRTLSKTEKWITGIFFLVFLPCICVYHQKKDNSLYRNPEFTHAVVFKLTKGGYRTSSNVHYEFSVNDVKYQGFGRREVNIDKIGDRIVVIYDKTNPHNNKPCRESKYSRNCHNIVRRQNVKK